MKEWHLDACLPTFNAAAAHPQTASVCLQGRLAGKLVSCQVAKNKHEASYKQKNRILEPYDSRLHHAAAAAVTHTHTAVSKGFFLLTFVNANHSKGT